MNYGCDIESIGIKLPEKQLSTVEIESRLKANSSLKLELLTGISNRRVCGENEDSLTLAVDAALDCLAHSELKTDELEMIISCSISKYINGLSYCYEPALSLLIKQKIGNTKALNFDISNACAGMITGVHIANNFIKQGRVKNCLVVSGEYITGLVENAIRNVDSLLHPEVASLTVGDAGAAVILTRTKPGETGLSVSEISTMGRFSHLCTGAQSDKGPGAIMKTNMKAIHDLSIKNAPYVVENALLSAGLRMSEIDYLIPHQTAKISILSGAKVLNNYFKEKPGEIVCNLCETGNTASTTHFAALYKYLCEKRFKTGDNIMLLSFASGLTFGTVIFSMNGITNRYGNNN
uniref:3-oxoacyl-ACP synthase III family protein n=1 Tax=uncultured Draconibacterium sp. TaxID=1573823 RepID=UPI0032172E8A